MPRLAYSWLALLASLAAAAPAAGSPPRKVDASTRAAADRAADLPARLAVVARSLGRDFRVKLEPGDHWDDKITYPVDELAGHSDRHALGVICEQIGHRRYSRALSGPLAKNGPFSYLRNSLERLRVDRLMSQRFAGVRGLLDEVYAEGHSGEPETRSQQFAQAFFDAWRRGPAAQPNAADPDVKAAIAEARPFVEQATALPRGVDLRFDDLTPAEAQREAEASFAVVRDRVWPIFERLVKADLEDPKTKDKLAEQQREQDKNGEAGESQEGGDSQSGGESKESQGGAGQQSQEGASGQKGGKSGQSQGGGAGQQAGAGEEGAGQQAGGQDGAGQQSGGSGSAQSAKGGGSPQGGGRQGAAAGAGQRPPGTGSSQGEGAQQAQGEGESGQQAKAGKKAEAAENGKPGEQSKPGAGAKNGAKQAGDAQSAKDRAAQAEGAPRDPLADESASPSLEETRRALKSFFEEAAQALEPKIPDPSSVTGHPKSLAEAALAGESANSADEAVHTAPPAHPSKRETRESKTGQQALDHQIHALREQLRAKTQPAKADAILYRAIKHTRRREIADLVMEIGNALERDDLPALEGYYQSGVYDLRRAIQSKLEKQATGRSASKKFLRRMEPTERRTEFVFIHDISSSMADNGKIDALREGSVMLQEAGRELNIAHGLIAFADVPYVLADSANPPDERQREALLDRLTPSGSTEATPALALGRQMLERSTANNRIILFLTDGQVDAECRAAVESAERAGIRVIGIGLGAGTESVPQTFKNHLVVGDVTQLPRELGKLLKQVVLEQRG